ncbi:cold shock domain-containing protein (plasmid) [Rhodobacteraceae bacterium SC52]|nr:cold shock domain-containing protein [Rhodobacteraceae bacterium SC52]
MDLDSSRDRFEEIKTEFETSSETARTEEDVRFRLINRLVTEVLGWDFNEVQTEEPNESGFSDYLLQSDGRTRAVIEVKRTSHRMTQSKAKSLSFLKVGGSGLDAARAGLNQAASYCFQEGVDFAVVTNGTTWILFRASRTDGKRPSEGQAAVFNNLNVVLENFQVFYELLGREHLTNRVYRAILDEQEGFKLLPKEELHFPYGASAASAGSKSDHGRDLDDVFDSFFSTISGENDNTLLMKCFVESKESQHAEKVLARITNEVLEQLEPMESSAGGQLASEIHRAAAAQRGEKILLIGNKGSGKSTFIDRFFEMTLDESMRRRCLVLKLDLAGYEAGTSALADWLDRNLQAQIDKQLYNDKPPSFDELQGVFHSIYQRWSVGPHKHLYETDLTAFKVKFGEHLEDIIDKRPHEYCVSQLKNAIASRHRLPCIVFDNTDQFPSEVQQAVFQYANALYEQTKVCFLIVPITDQTVWQLSKSGPLQSYQAKSFFLPVPSTKDVLRKRIQFIASEVDETDTQSGRYSLPNGIQVALDDLRAFAGTLEEVFLNNEFVARRIGYLANFDIRRSLELSKRLMTSPHIGIDDLIRTFLSGGNLDVKSDALSTALICGQNKMFRLDQSDFVLDLFEIDSSLISSPLLRLRILILLLDKQRSVHDPLESFLTCSEIEQYFEVIGVSAQITRSNIQTLLNSRLVEPYNPTEGQVVAGQSVSISTSGEMHAELALHDSAYVSQMALVTPIRDHVVATEIKSVNEGKLPNYRRSNEIRAKFLDYCAKQDAVFCKIPERNDNYANQRSLVDELQVRTTKTDVAASVKWFNPREGYGFVTLDQQNRDAFLSLTVVEQFGLGRVYEKQNLICTVAESARGWQVTELTSVDDIVLVEQTKEPVKELVLAKVTFYNSIKGYGFLEPEDGGRDILLPRRTLAQLGLNNIEEGRTVLVETEMQIKGPVAVGIEADST